MCFHFPIEYRRDSCELTYSYIYLLCPNPFVLSIYNMCYSMLNFDMFLYLFSLNN
jgi:hypothetical protein